MQQKKNCGAALHNPDQIAGGNSQEIHAFGDGAANSALGSLWRHGRADELYRQVNELAEEMTEEEKQRTYLDVRLDVL